MGGGGLVDPLVDAFGFLTVLPVGRRDRPPGARSVLAFPAVGLLVGALWAGVGWAGWRLWGPLPAAAVVLLADVAVTGAIHLDAVADVADGWASRKPPAAALEVIRDPRVGAVGAAVLVATMLCRWSLLAVLAGQAEPAGRWWLLAVAPVCGRAAMAWVLSRPRRLGPGAARDAANPPGDRPPDHRPPDHRPPGDRPPDDPRAGDSPPDDPRPGVLPPEAGRRSLTEGFGAGSWPAAGLAVAVGVAVATLTGGWRGALAAGLAAGVAEAFARFSARRFGRLTGDAAGAAGVAAEVVALALLTARW
jgi:cobalamin synthase